MIKRIILFLFVSLLMSSIVNAELNECLDVVDTDCMIITPVTVNATNNSQILTDQICNITIYNLTGTFIDNLQMDNGTYGAGIHNFTFNATAPGVYIIGILCKQGSDYGRISDTITFVSAGGLHTIQDNIAEINSTQIYWLYGFFNNMTTQTITQETMNGIPLEMFILFEIIAFILFFIAVKLDDSVVYPILAMVLFFILAGLSADIAIIHCELVDYTTTVVCNSERIQQMPVMALNVGMGLLMMAYSFMAKGIWKKKE